MQRRPQRSLRTVEADSESPVLQWVTLAEPDAAVELDDGDDVVDSYFDPRRDAWEALVLAGPADEDAE